MKLSEIKMDEMTIDSNLEIPDLTDQQVDYLADYFKDGLAIDKIEATYSVIEKGDDYGLLDEKGDFVGYLQTKQIIIAGQDYRSLEKIQIRKAHAGKNLAKAFIFWIKELKAFDLVMVGTLFKGGQHLVSKLAADGRFQLSWINLKTGEIEKDADVNNLKYRKDKQYGILTEGSGVFQLKPWIQNLPGSDERFYFPVFTIEDEE